MKCLSRLQFEQYPHHRLDHIDLAYSPRASFAKNSSKHSLKYMSLRMNSFHGGSMGMPGMGGMGMPGMGGGGADTPSMTKMRSLSASERNAKKGQRKRERDARKKGRK